MDIVDLNTENNYFPCPLEMEWDLVRIIEIPSHSPSKGIMGGFSAITYQKENDKLWLLNDGEGEYGYLLAIKNFKKIINNFQKKIDSSSIDIIKLKNDKGRKLNQTNGEGLIILGNKALIVDEGRKFNPRKPYEIKRPPSLNVFDLRNGRKLDFKNLPFKPKRPFDFKRFGNLATGVESLSVFQDGGFIVATEGNIKDKTVKDKTARYTISDNNFNFSKVKEFPIIHGKLRELLVLGNSNRMLALSTYRDKNKIELRAYIKSYVIKKDSNTFSIQGPIYKWQLPLPGKWEGMTFGPSIRGSKTSLLLVADNDHKPYKKNIISIVIPKSDKYCLN